MFNPSEIIFATTQACNLHCPHCFVSRNPKKLDSKTAITFLESCKGTDIYKIGFSGGEPFLNLDFMLEVISWAYKNDFCFDQIMTNGDWWKTEEELLSTLRQIQDAGYDGNIGLSYDGFHNQDFDRIKTFARSVNHIFGEESLNVQAVADPSSTPEQDTKLESELNILAEEYTAEVYILPQTFQAADSRAWQSKKWFKEDYCEGPGQILFVHATGDIAPCCGFANENPALFIGNINTDTFDTLIKKACENKMVNICYNTGLLKEAKMLYKEGKLPGITGDICSFCDWLCNNKTADNTVNN